MANLATFILLRHLIGISVTAAAIPLDQVTKLMVARVLTVGES